MSIHPNILTTSKDGFFKPTLQWKTTNYSHKSISHIIKMQQYKKLIYRRKPKGYKDTKRTTGNTQNNTMKHLNHYFSHNKNKITNKNLNTC